MGQISELTTEGFKGLEREVQKATRGCATLEEAAQKFTTLVHEKLGDTVVLARVFATVPFGKLPPANRDFVTSLLKSTGGPAAPGENVLVLSLVGTSGSDKAWNDRRSSKGHVGIPLTSATFIEAIPMVSRLLKELGLGLDWIDSGDTSIVGRTLGNTSGVFYVRDAASEVDARNRKVIAAQDFVAAHGVKTVFGIGGAYMGTATFLVSIFFCKSDVEKSKVEALIPLINRFKVSTVDLAREGRVFTA